MLRKIIDTAVTAIEALAIGVIVGALAGAALGWIFGYLTTSAEHRLDEAGALGFFLALFGASAGLVAGAGISVLGSRPISRFEWPLTIGAGLLVGFSMTDSGFGWQIIGLAAGLAAVAWLVVVVIQRILSSRIVRNPLKPFVVTAYLAAFVLMAFVVRTILTSLMRILS